MVVGKESVLALMDLVRSTAPAVNAVSLSSVCISPANRVGCNAHNMQGDAGSKPKQSIFALLWNRSTEHFQVMQCPFVPYSQSAVERECTT